MTPAYVPMGTRMVARARAVSRPQLAAWSAWLATAKQADADRRVRDRCSHGQCVGPPDQSANH